MNNQTYDILKRLALIVIPALATFVNAVDEYHVICQGGVRSASACEFLSAQGLTVINVEGGMNAWPGQVE